MLRSNNGVLKIAYRTIELMIEMNEIMTRYSLRMDTDKADTEKSPEIGKYW